MSLNVFRRSEPNTPTASTSDIYMAIVDNKMMSKTDTGIVSHLNPQVSVNKNGIMNSSFMIQQKIAVASTAIAGVSTTTRAGVVADRWSVTASVTSNLNWQQVDTAAAQETNLQSRYYGSIISSTAGKKVMISQWIRNNEMKHLLGRKVRISFNIRQKSGTTGQKYKLGLIQLNASGTVDTSPAFLASAWSITTGIDPVWGTNLVAITPDSDGQIGGAIVGSFFESTNSTAAWKAPLVTPSAVFTIPADSKNLVIVLFADATGGTTDNLSLSEFNMTIGENQYDWIEESFGSQLRECQAYYSKSFAYGTVPAQNATVVNAVGGIAGKAGAVALAGSIAIRFPVTMVASPTVTLYCPTESSAQIDRIDGTTPIAHTGTAQIHLGDAGVFCTSTGTTNTAVGDTLAVHYSATAETIN